MAKRSRPVDGVQRRYIWKLYPSDEQRTQLREQATMCAQLWNALLEMCEQRYQMSGRGHVFHCGACSDATEDHLKEKGKWRRAYCEAHKPPTEFDMGYWITGMLAECPEWRALSTWTPRRIAGQLAAAFTAFFSRAKAGAGASSGYPRYKSTVRHSSIPHRCVSGCAISKSPRHLNSWTIRLKGVGDLLWARGALPSKPNEWLDVDIMFLDGNWWASAAVVVPPRRSPGTLSTIVRFDLVDGFAWINDSLETPSGLVTAGALQDQADSMKSELDLRWPRGKRYSESEWQERCDAMSDIKRLTLRIKRMRANALHIWTTRIVAYASDLTIVTPAIKPNTKTPRGDEREWGASINLVSDLNRNTLSYAPAMAVQMLTYKAKEAGIRCDVIEDEAPAIAVGSDLVHAGKELRRARRKMKEAAE